MLVTIVGTVPADRSFRLLAPDLPKKLADLMEEEGLEVDEVRVILADNTGE